MRTPPRSACLIGLQNPAPLRLPLAMRHRHPICAPVRLDWQPSALLGICELFGGPSLFAGWAGFAHVEQVGTTGGREKGISAKGQSVSMIGFGERQGHFSVVIRLPHANRAGVRRKKSSAASGRATAYDETRRSTTRPAPATSAGIIRAAQHLQLLERKRPDFWVTFTNGSRPALLNAVSVNLHAASGPECPLADAPRA